MIVDKTTITKMTMEASQSNCGADSEFFPDNNASIWRSSSASLAPATRIRSRSRAYYLFGHFGV